MEALILLDTTPHLSGYFPQNVASAAAVLLGKLAFKPAKAVVAGVAATHPLAPLRPRVITGRECSKVSNRAMVRTLNRARNYDVTDRLAGIKVPALIVVGTADLLADLRHARTMARGLPNSTLKVVHGAGHMALFEKPEEVNRAIASFLSRKKGSNLKSCKLKKGARSER